MKRFFKILLLTILSLSFINKANAIETIPTPDIKLIINQNDTNADIPKEVSEQEALQEDEKVIDNSDVEFSNFDNVVKEDEVEELEITGTSLFQKIYKTQIERTDIPTYLLQDELTFEFSKGPVRKAQLFAAYRGDLAATFEGADYDTNYMHDLVQLGVIGITADKNTSFLGRFNIVPHSGRSYFHDFVADAYFVNTIIPNNKILVGYSRNQVGVEGGMPLYTQPFVARAQIARHFGSTRALGVRLVGEYPLVNYSLAFNSSDRFFHSFFPGVEFTGWVNFKPLAKTDGKWGNLILGTGLNTGKNHENYTVGGAYVAYKYKRFFANFEYSIADGYNGAYVSTNKASGFYTTLAYKITPKLQVLARADHFNPNRDLKNAAKDEYTFGINYFLKGQALKLIFNYVFCHNHNAPDSNRLIVGTQILL